VSMRFPDERMAQFVVSYAATSLDQYRVVGDKGDLEVSPGFTFGAGLKHRLTVGDRISEKAFSATDQFGGELHYFSDCILRGWEPEPNGLEGLADVRIIAAIERALESGHVQKIDAIAPRRHLGPTRVEKLPLVKPPRLVGAAAPGEG
jgi:predicted dehydrogenase